METKEQIKERLIELNWYLLQSINKDYLGRTEAIKNEINELINQYLKWTENN